MTASKLPVDLVDAFLMRAGDSPLATAVEHRGFRTTYEELLSNAQQLAGAIHATAVPSPRVLLALPPSNSAYAAMLGSLIAGGTFCPINLSGPERRNAAMCKAFAPDLILYEETPPAFLDAVPVNTRLVDVRSPGSVELSSPLRERSEVAYVIFTSGSTGNPKGVKLGRKAFSHFLSIAASYFNTTAEERWGQFSNIGHDLGVMDVFMALTQGATLVPLSKAECLQPADAIKAHHISIWQSVPSAIDLMRLAKELTSVHVRSLRIMSLCGEPLRPDHLDELFQVHPALEVFNTYGATETTGFNTINRLTAENYRDSCKHGRVAIGDDVPGWQLHLFDDSSMSEQESDDVPRWQLHLFDDSLISEQEGQIAISSDFLSLGYWRDEDRTRSAFRDVQTPEGGYRRVYFTGDYGRRIGSRVFCMGRMDRQIKIRGERVELDEVDAHLRDAGFVNAYTIHENGELYSFVESQQDVDTERVRTHLSKALPFHAVPKSIRALPTLPRNQNGKIDHDALLRELLS